MPWQGFDALVLYYSGERTFLARFFRLEMTQNDTARGS
jgi:hypothetical protein